MIPCDGSCECSETGFCVSACLSQNDCSCGESCHGGKCRVKCDINNECAKVFKQAIQFFSQTLDSVLKNWFDLKMKLLFRATHVTEAYA